MSLDRFKRTRMVVLTQRATIYQAARAMADNHIGAVLVSRASKLAGIVTDRDLAIGVLGGDLDPRTTPLSEVMSEGLVTCDIGATLDDVVQLMINHAVRRIPITENDRPVGLITFDDLVIDGSIGPDVLRAIVAAQLEVEAPHKPARCIRKPRRALSIKPADVPERCCAPRRGPRRPSAAWSWRSRQPQRSTAHAPSAPWSSAPACCAGA